LILFARSCLFNGKLREKRHDPSLLDNSVVLDVRCSLHVKQKLSVTWLTTIQVVSLGCITRTLVFEMTRVVRGGVNSVEKDCSSCFILIRLKQMTFDTNCNGLRIQYWKVSKGKQKRVYSFSNRDGTKKATEFRSTFLIKKGWERYWLLEFVY
jgi:hypothetical protein